MGRKVTLWLSILNHSIQHIIVFHYPLCGRKLQCFFNICPVRSVIRRLEEGNFAHVPISTLRRQFRTFAFIAISSNSGRKLKVRNYSVLSSADVFLKSFPGKNNISRNAEGTLTINEVGTKPLLIHQLVGFLC